MNFDIVIVGGGLAGLALAAGLRRAAFSVALVEGQPPGRPQGWDARIYAISPANARFLEEIGIWPHLDRQRMTPVRAMEVFGDRGGHLTFSAYDSGVAELAWIVESSLLQCELWETVKRQGNLRLFSAVRPQALEISADAALLTLADGRVLRTSLVVAADGADSWTRAAAGIEVDWKAYGQLGVVANFATEKPHHDTAFQWFREDGILAWLPLPGNRFSMVWSTPEAHGRELMALDAAALCERVAAAGGGRLGGLELVTPAAGFPLRLMRAPRVVAPRLALIGDAAHTIHPLSGHGINLGFQDARTLASVLCRKVGPENCGELTLLRRYERARKEDVVLLQTVTDGLQRLFKPASGLLPPLRNLGLNLTQHLPVVKNALVRHALAS